MSHLEHLNGFPPVCVFSCLFKPHCCEKLLLHFAHLNDFSPVWNLVCVLKALGQGADVVSTVHRPLGRNGRSWEGGLTWCRLDPSPGGRQVELESHTHVRQI